VRVRVGGQRGMLGAEVVLLLLLSVVIQSVTVTVSLAV
jgi:hypothetical protein